MDIVSNEFCSQKEKSVKIISLVAVAFMLSASLGLGGHFWLTKSTGQVLNAFSFFGEIMTYVMAAGLLYAYDQHKTKRLGALKIFCFMLIVLSLFWFWIPFRHSPRQILINILVGLGAFAITAIAGYCKKRPKVDVYDLTVFKLILFLAVFLLLDVLLCLAAGIPPQGHLLNSAVAVFMMTVNYGIFQQLARDDCFYTDKSEKNQEMVEYAILLSWVLLGIIPSAFIFKLFFYMAYGLKFCNIIKRTKQEPFS